MERGTPFRPGVRIDGDAPIWKSTLRPAVFGGEAWMRLSNQAFLRAARWLALLESKQAGEAE